MTSRTNVTAKQSPEAVASMAGIGRSIDQAIGRLSPPALGLPTIQIVSPSNDTNQGRGSGSSPPQIDKSLIDLPAPSAESAPPTPPAETAPPQRSAPPLPKLKPLRKEAEAISMRPFSKPPKRASWREWMETSEKAFAPSRKLGARLTG
jgi:hypothetical protein